MFTVTKGGILFRCEEADENWNNFIAEREFSIVKFDIPEIKGLISDVGLLKSVTMVKPFGENIMREIIANIYEDTGKMNSENYGVVIVRNQRRNIAPYVINEHFGISRVEKNKLDT